ncbi:MAG: hypothetical protein ACP5OZ_04090 [Candidatus Woesearchaeota archaeon]
MALKNLEESINEFSDNIKNLMNSMSNMTKDNIECLEGYLFEVLKDFKYRRIGELQVRKEKDKDNVLIIDYKKPTGDELEIKIEFDKENKENFSVKPNTTKLRPEKIIEYLSEINWYLNDYWLKIKDRIGRNYGLELQEFEPKLLNSTKLLEFLEEYSENPELARNIVKKMFFDQGKLQMLFNSERAVYVQNEKNDRIKLYYDSSVCYPKKAIVLELGNNFNIFYSGFDDKEVNENIVNAFENKNFLYAYKQTLLDEVKEKSKLNVKNLRLNTGFSYLYLGREIRFAKQGFYNDAEEIRIMLDKGNRKIEKINGVNEKNIDDAIKILQIYFNAN